MEDFFNYRRRKSSIVNIGNTPLGGDNPIRIQSMANVSTMDTCLLYTSDAADEL